MQKSHRGNKMKIISHRGYWKSEEEKNTALAFHRSFKLGFGTETDVRDHNGKLVISHDIPDEKAMLFSDFLDILSDYNSLDIALNIKSDGLSTEIEKSLSSANLNHNFFVFDMSIPDMKSYFNTNGIEVYSRMSEVERKPVWNDLCHGIWLDSFGNEWYEMSDIVQVLSLGKKVCVVSSELHKRSYKKQWELLLEFKENKNLILCTDIPETAKNYFRK